MFDQSASSESFSFPLPFSHPAFPQALVDQIKYLFWRLYTPLHPYARDTLLALGILEHSGRQPFLIGVVAPEFSIEDTVAHLVERGFGNHFIAWKDEGEVVSLRRPDGFARQYHIRIFNDGQIRGHYEYTPECRPILHFKAIDQQDRRQEFLELLGEKIRP
jgi:hypothetical protein